MTGRLALQVCLVAAGSVAVAAGGSGLLHPPPGMDPEAISHARYLSGLLLALGVVGWTIVPDVVHKRRRLGLIVAIVATGGLCRLLGVALGDPLSWQVTASLAMELAIVPLLFVWQTRLNASATMPVVPGLPDDPAAAHAARATANDLGLTLRHAGRRCTTSAERQRPKDGSDGEVDVIRVRFDPWAALLAQRWGGRRWGGKGRGVDAPLRCP